MSEIKLISIAELMDGRTFLIPSYQRGYRWTEKEIKDFLNDLYSFALKKGKKAEEFYCLQPIITQRSTDEIFNELMLMEGNIQTANKALWKVIDGQQRLTSSFILYKYLLDKKNWDAQELEDEEGKQVFHLAYETRKATTQFLDKLSASSLDNSDIDRSHISAAYEIIDQWIRTEGKTISDIYGRKNTPSSIRDVLFSLLNCPRGVVEETGSAQFIWYEIEASSDESNRDVEISEFLKINTGKIELTDAELLKALFLQSKNFEMGEEVIKQLQIAMEWEQIENTLHQNDFWHFFYGKADKPNRIDALFELIYKADHIRTYSDSISENIKACNKELKTKNTLFRYYYNKFDGKSGEELQNSIKGEWRKIMDAFHTLEDWYEDTKVYNYVGFLSHCGMDIAQMYIKFSLMDDTASKEDLEDYFNEQIKIQLSGIVVEDGIIMASYKNDKDKAAIFKLLLFLNVYQQNNQYSKVSESGDDFNGSIFKFPFDIFDSQKWNLEHIDSFTTNQLRDTEDLKDWCATAIHEMEQFNVAPAERDRVKELFNQGSYKDIIERVKGYFEGESDDESKNLIGNLTLLDERTNKSYGNSLFCTKKRIIKEREENGTFVPVTTKWVFEKHFSGSHSSDIYWKDEDKQAYQDYIVEHLGQYLNQTSRNDESVLF